MTDKNKENLLNIYDNQDTDDLFSTDNESTEKDINKISLDSENKSSNSAELDFVDADILNKDIIDISEENIEETINPEDKEVSDLEDISEENIKHEDGLDELKDDGEKKSLFGNIFKRKNKKEKISEEKEENIDKESSDLEDISEENIKHEDGLDELKDDGEKKSLFGNIFKRKNKKEDISEETEESIDKEAIDLEDISEEKEESIDKEAIDLEDISEEKEESIDKEAIDLEDISEENIKPEDGLDVGFMDGLDELKDDGEKKSLFGNIFKRKNKKEDISEEKEESIDKEDSYKSSNIFDDFNQDDSLLDEVDQIKQDRDRDVFYYLNKAGKTLQVIFILCLLLLALLYSYIYVQNKIFVNENKDNQLLGPFCFVLLNGVNYEGNFCTSISTLKDDYTNKLDDTKSSQIAKILNVVKVLYEIENFTKTKDVTFLKDKTEGKLDILKIIEEFDNLKNEFAKVDKQTIQCKGIKINQKDEILSMSCSAYSAGFESGIRGFDGKNEPGSLLKGTSISIANSFLNYITLESKIFTIIDRQRLFKADSVVGSKTGFTSRTSFTLKLKYNLD